MKLLLTLLLSLLALTGLRAANPSFRDLVLTNGNGTVSNRVAGSNFVFRAHGTNRSRFTFDTTALETGLSNNLVEFANGGTNRLKILPHGGINMGRDDNHVFSPSSSDILTAIYDSSIGDPAIAELQIKAVNGWPANTAQSFFRARVRSDGSGASLDMEEKNAFWNVQVSPNNTFFLFGPASGNGVDMLPDSGNTSRAYAFGTAVTHVSGDLFAIQNQSVPVWKVDFAGNAVANGSVTATNGVYYPSNTFTVASISAGFTNGDFWVGTLSNALQAVWMSNNVTLFKKLAP